MLGFAPAIVDKIRTSMPPENPATIPAVKVSDLVALILARNQFPSGHAELTADQQQLKDIKISKARP